jgi:hypothetical protein
MSKSQGTIKGKGDGKWGRVTINRDGSILLENVEISGVVFENCDIRGESGENPIPFADRVNAFHNYVGANGEGSLRVSGRTDEQREKDRRPSQTEKDRTRRFYLEPDMLTGKTDVMSVQAIGRWGDNIFVVEAETEDEAQEKLRDLLEKRVYEGEVRPATEDEAKEFEVFQREAMEFHEFAARLHEKYGSKGLENEGSHGKE